MGKITYFYTSLALRITRIFTNVYCYSTNNEAYSRQLLHQHTYDLLLRTTIFKKYVP
jgi:hypothetical protein